MIPVWIAACFKHRVSVVGLLLPAGQAAGADALAAAVCLHSFDQPVQHTEMYLKEVQ